MSWTDGEEPITQAFTYDRMGRLTSAVQPNSPALSETGITYDRNGNLKTLLRRDAIGDSRNDLTYTYQGNILTDINNNGTSYTYSHDGNGNRSTDGRKGVNISYNVLNLPDKVRLNTSANTEKAAFVYLADGTSVGMFARLSGTTYAGNLTMGTLTYTKYPSLVVQGAEFAAGRIKERSDYYPFGARMYDPCLGRWTTQDPLAEKYPGISPYAYCVGNPMNPGGRDGGFTCKVPCVKYKFNYVMQIDLG